MYTYTSEPRSYGSTFLKLKHVEMSTIMLMFFLVPLAHGSRTHNGHMGQRSLNSNTCNNEHEFNQVCG